MDEKKRWEVPKKRIALAVILSRIPLNIASTLRSDKTSTVSSSPVEDHWVGLLPSIVMGARRRNLRLVRGSAESVCLCAHRYLHHAPPIPHTWPRTLTTPLHATTLHSHLLPAYTLYLITISPLTIHCLSQRAHLG